MTMLSDILADIEALGVELPKGREYAGFQQVYYDSTKRDMNLVTDTADAALDWVILGGEAGPGARPMQPEWALDVYRQCKAAGVAFYFKQWGTATKTDRRQSLYGPDIMDMEATHELPKAGP